MRQIILGLLALVLAACGDDAPQTVLQGYVEGHSLNLAPRTSGILQRVTVREGDRVAAGTVLFHLDTAEATARLEEGIAARQASAAQLANLRKGGRPEEIRAAQEKLAETRAALTLAEQSFQRSQDLVARGVVPVARMDQDRATRDAARARVTEAQSRLDLVRLPAREDVIAAAEGDVVRLEAAVRQAQIALEDRTVQAPVAGRIEEIFRRQGEAAGPTQPVLSLLPPGQMRIRFFVPEKMLPRVHPGGVMDLYCDNCPAGLQGKITFIAHEAEFTPPIIFTEKERAKLVYMFEVTPDHPDKFLNGQPVEGILP